MCSGAHAVRRRSRVCSDSLATSRRSTSRYIISVVSVNLVSCLRINACRYYDAFVQAAKLLQSRVAKFQEAKRAAEAPSASTVSAAALVRKIELESLQKELSHLKSAVVDTFIHPQSEATETEESGVEPVETHATAAAEVPASDAKSSGIKLSLTPREQTSSSSSAIFDCVTADSLVGDDEESSMTSKTPFMLSS